MKSRQADRECSSYFIRPTRFLVAEAFWLLIILACYGCKSPYLPKGSSPSPQANPAPADPGTPPAASISLGPQTGVMASGTPGTATFSVSAANIAAGSTGSLSWYADASGSTAASAPTGIAISISAILAGTATVTCTSNDTVVAGSYYFRISYGSTVSSPSELHVSALYVYVANFGSSTGVNGISSFSLGAGGTLIPITAGTFDTGRGPYSIAVDQKTYTLFLTNANDHTISRYAIDSSGALVKSADYSAGLVPFGMAISPNSQYLFSANNGGSSLSAFTINSDGSLNGIVLGSLAVENSPYNLAITPDSRFLYVTHGNATGSVSGYRIDPVGSLSAIGNFATGPNPYYPVVSHDGKLLFVTNQNNNSVSTYSINPDGTLTVLGSSTSTGTQPRGAAITRDDKFLYIAHYQSTGPGGLYAYSIGSSGELTPISTYATGSHPNHVAISPAGTYIFVTNSVGYASNGLSEYRINSDGSLSPITTVATGPNNRGVALCLR